MVQGLHKPTQLNDLLPHFLFLLHTSQSQISHMLLNLNSSQPSKTFLIKMDIPKHSSHHHSASGTDHAPNVYVQLFNNPITYEILLMIAVVSFALLILKVVECLRPCIAPDDNDNEGGEGDDEQQDQPRDLTLTRAEDGRLLDDESQHPHRYGTFYVNNGSWYNADGYALPNKTVSSLYPISYSNRQLLTLVTERK